jgi:DNA-binding response OmpR family regulator
MINLLLIDDDRKHSELLKSYLGQFGMQLECAGNAEEGLRKLARKSPDLLLLDVMLPGRDGFDICREVRKTSRIPIIMLTARGDVVDRVSGLEIGADDYIGKPFEPRELVARIQSILRRAGERDANESLLQFEGIRIDLEARSVEVDGNRVNLTAMEFELLALLAVRAGKKVSRDEILNKLRGIDAAILTRSVDIMVSRLRHKLGDTLKPPRFIETVWAVGYRFIGRRQDNV